MEDPFDTLARRLSGRISRRQALRLVLGASAASLVAARADAPLPCEERRQCSDSCCPENTECCTAGGASMCCPTAGLVLFPCPATIERALMLGCMRLTP